MSGLAPSAQTPAPDGVGAAPAASGASAASAAGTAPASGPSDPVSTDNTPAPSTGGATASSASSAGQDDNLVCHWGPCKEPFVSAESLYVSCPVD